MNNNSNNFLFNDVSSIKGVGKKTKIYFKKKNIDKIKDLFFDLPYEITDRSKISNLIWRSATANIEYSRC